MSAMTLPQRLEEIRVKSDELATVFSEAGEAVDLDLVKSIDPNGTMSTEDKVAWIRDREKELGDLNAEAKRQADLLKSSASNAQLKSVLDLLDMPANAIGHAVKAAAGSPFEAKSLGELFTDEFSMEAKGAEIELKEFEVKALFETSAGWAPESTRTGKLVDFATRPVQVLDFIPTTTTGQAAVVYMEETTYTQAAAETAEGGAFPESAFQLAEVSSPVRKISHFIPVTDEQLEDVSQVQGYLNNRLAFGIRQRTDGQVLVGDGIAPNLEGIVNRTGVQTQAKATDPIPDAIHKGLTKARVTGRSIPNAVMLHSNDWERVRLLRTADGIYIWGSPAETGIARIWGLPVVQTEVLTEGVGLVGDFANFSELAIRRGITLKVSDSHGTYFVEGKQAIRADFRAALQVYRPEAFCTVTGLNA